MFLQHKDVHTVHVAFWRSEARVMGAGGAAAWLQTVCLNHRCPPSGDTSRGCSMEGAYMITAG